MDPGTEGFLTRLAFGGWDHRTAVVAYDRVWVCPLDLPGMDGAAARRAFRRQMGHLAGVSGRGLGSERRFASRLEQVEKDLRFLSETAVPQFGGDAQGSGGYAGQLPKASGGLDAAPQIGHPLLTLPAEQKALPGKHVGLNRSGYPVGFAMLGQSVEFAGGGQVIACLPARVCQPQPLECRLEDRGENPSRPPASEQPPPHATHACLPRSV
jgi:hypothetical protein